MLLDDPFAFALIQDSDTVGMFQLESPGQQDLVGRLQPRDPQDVIADISLFGPGPVLFPHWLCPSQVMSHRREVVPLEMSVCCCEVCPVYLAKEFTRRDVGGEGLSAYPRVSLGRVPVNVPGGWRQPGGRANKLE